VVKTWRAWTAGELDRLDELRFAGWTIARIAAELGRTDASIRNAAKAYEKSRMRAGQYLTAFSARHTIAGVAARLGVTKGAVKQQKRRLRRAGFKVRRADRE
jgi:predicted transcriptional regulator